MIDELKVGHHVARAIVLLARLSMSMKQEKNKKVIREACHELRIAIGVEDEDGDALDPKTGEKIKSKSKRKKK